MKITYINSFYYPMEVGGAEKSVRFLAESMAARGHDTQVIALGRETETSGLNGVTIERLTCSNVYFPTDAGSAKAWQKMIWHGLDSYNLLAEHAIGRLLDRFKPDVVHSNNISGFSVSAWRAASKRKIPLVHTLRDYYLLCPNTAMFKNGRPCQTQCGSCSVLSKPRSLACSMVDTVIGNSQFILDKHLSYGLFGQSQQGVVYNAYKPGDAAKSNIAHPFVLGYIGRLAPTKGVEVLIDAVKLLGSSVNCRLIIAGEGDPAYVAALRARSQGLNVEFTGRVQPEWFYNQIHWTIVPSLWDEPLARVLFESFTHGVPVIGSATGGTPELIEPAKTGFLYSDAESPAALADRIREAHQMPADVYQATSAHCVSRSSTFRPDNVYRQYLHHYESAISSGALA